MKPPRETVIFAAGIGTLSGNWHVIAATLAHLGLGTWRPEELELAARDWVVENVPGNGPALTDAIAATRPGRTAWANRCLGSCKSGKRRNIWRARI